MRGNWGRGGLAVVLCLVMALSACTTDWIAQAEEIVAALIPAAGNLVTLVAALEGKSVSTADLATVQNAGTQAQADLELIQSLIAAYEKADAAAQPGILNQIQSAIGAAQGTLQGLLGALHIKDTATQTKITAVVGILLSEVQALASVVPIVKAESQNPHPVAQIATRVGHPPVPLSASQFVRSYNATMTAKTRNGDLDRVTAGLQIHVHRKLERVATVGMLK